MHPAFDVLDPSDPRPEAREALREWLSLQRALALRPQEAVELLRPGRGPRAALALSSQPRASEVELDAAVDALRRAAAVAVPFGSPRYPERLARLSDAAPLLLVRGDVSALSAPCVAVVGSRAATVYGRAMAARFAERLAAEGLVVVSGLATGIDAVAHGAALDAGGRTLAVLACGPERVYPSRHRRLSDRIVRSGTIVSEFPPGTPPLRPYFPLRNRLISGLSLAVLVVEARERSGSLITASHAADQGVDVYAVPGPITSPTSVGTNRLLRDGAYVALDAEALLEALRLGGAIPPRPVDAPLDAAPRERAAERADHGGEQVVTALLDEPLTRDELGRRLSRSPQQLALELLELELGGRVAEDRDGRLRVVSPAKTPEL